MSDRDNITLPREVVQEALEALELEATSPPLETTAAAMAALRAALAAPKQEPVAWLSRDEARLALWKAINSREFGNPTDDKLILDHLRQQGLWIGKVTSPALAAEPTKPVVISKDWLKMTLQVNRGDRVLKVERWLHLSEIKQSRFPLVKATADSAWQELDAAMKEDKK